MDFLITPTHSSWHINYLPPILKNFSKSNFPPIFWIFKSLLLIAVSTSIIFLQFLTYLYYIHPFRQLICSSPFLANNTLQTPPSPCFPLSTPSFLFSFNSQMTDFHSLDLRSIINPHIHTSYSLFKVPSCLCTHLDWNNVWFETNHTLQWRHSYFHPSICLQQVLDSLSFPQGWKLECL